MSDPNRNTVAFAWAPRPGEIDVPLSEDYLEDIRWLESLPENQSGTDKTWVEKAIEQSLAHLAKAIRIR